ncbi:hypothetical protein MBTS_10930 [Methylobacterium bullatum]|nr:hypothetical protein [Methylobacterium bullatum]
MLAPQVQFELFSRPVWPASLRTLELSGPSHLPARTVTSASSTRSVDMLQERTIGSDLLENKSSDRQLLSIGHSVSLPGVEVHSTPMEKPVANFFWSETDNADVL